MMRNAWCSIEEVPYYFSRSSIKFQGYMGKKIDNLNPILSKITRQVAAIKSLRFALFTLNWNVHYHEMYESLISIVSYGMLDKRPTVWQYLGLILGFHSCEYQSINIYPYVLS